MRRIHDDIAALHCVPFAFVHPLQRIAETSRKLVLNPVVIHELVGTHFCVVECTSPIDSVHAVTTILSASIELLLGSTARTPANTVRSVSRAVFLIMISALNTMSSMLCLYTAMKTSIMIKKVKEPHKS